MLSSYWVVPHYFTITTVSFWVHCHNHDVMRDNNSYSQLVYISHILCHTFKNLISTCSLNCAEYHDIGHAHFRLLCFSANSPTFSNSSQAISTILADDHWVDMQPLSVAYLHLGLSKWHETQVTTSTWAPMALWKNDKFTFSNSS